jgi:hypothetical protein
MSSKRFLLPILLLGGLSLAGCDIEPVDPSEVVTLTGVVLDASTNRPIGGATVTTAPATSQATTGSDGHYSIAGVAGGYYTIAVTAAGYRTASISIAARSSNPPDTIRLQESFPNAGLVAYFPLNGSAVDASGRGHNGMAVATANTADRFGQLDGAMLFDGRASTITVPNAADLNFAAGTDYSIVAWVRFSALQTQRPGVVAKSSGGSALRGYELRITGGKAEAEIGTSLGPVSSRTERFINDDRWHMIGIASEQARGLLHFCLDGDLVDVTPSTFLAGDVSSAASLLIGRSPATGAYYAGAIDDVRIFNRRLEKEDFRLLYHERGF